MPIVSNPNQVPNTDDFTLRNVTGVTGINGDSLSECFDSATDAYFDDTYEGQQDRLSNFRNYTVTTYSISIQTGENNLEFASPGDVTQTVDVNVVPSTSTYTAAVSYIDGSNWVNWTINNDNSIDVWVESYSGSIVGDKREADLTLTHEDDSTKTANINITQNGGAV